MPGSPARRRLATVLFVDIVGSTALASRIGDHRWRDLLSRFHRLVRVEVRRRDGRDQDTAGDGVLATFAEPARAVEAAAAIIGAVHELGLDVRAGIHTGEVGTIDGKLQGIAVNIGARVVALADAAEILTTGTVRDLVVGSAVTFEERGGHTLKGVEGTWQVYSVRELNGAPLPQPLTAEEAEARLDALTAAERPFYRRRAVLAAVGLAVVAAAIAVPLLASGGKTRKAAKPKDPISLVRIDGESPRVAAVVRDKAIARGHTGNLWSAGGNLWQLVGMDHGRLVGRNIHTGRIVRSLPLGLDACSCRIAFGFGSVWLANDTVVLKGPNAGQLRISVSRIDELSGRRHRITWPGDVANGTIATGNGAVWVLESDATLVRIDPLSNRVTARYDTKAVETSILIPVAGYEWICECIVNQVLRYDASARRGKTFDIPVQAQIVGVDSTDGKTLWLLDPQGATLTPMDPVTGTTKSPLGLGGEPQEAVVAFGAIWAASGGIVQRIDLETKERTTIAMPRGVWAGSIAADARSGAIWVGNSVERPDRQ
jgi:class 3 adenylate cyclase